MGHMPVRPYVKPSLKYRIIFRKPTVNRVSENVKEINRKLAEAKEKPATACHEMYKNTPYCVPTIKYPGKVTDCRVPWKKFVACLRNKMKEVMQGGVYKQTTQTGGIVHWPFKRQ